MFVWTPQLGIEPRAPSGATSVTLASQWPRRHLLSLHPCHLSLGKSRVSGVVQSVAFTASETHPSREHLQPVLFIVDGAPGGGTAICPVTGVVSGLGQTCVELL